MVKKAYLSVILYSDEWSPFIWINSQKTLFYSLGIMPKTRILDTFWIFSRRTSTPIVKASSTIPSSPGGFYFFMLFINLRYAFRTLVNYPVILFCLFGCVERLLYKSWIVEII